MFLLTGHVLTWIPRRVGVDGRMSAYHEVQDHVYIVNIHHVALAVLQKGAEQCLFMNERHIRIKEKGCGSAYSWYGFGSSILGWIPIRIQGFDDQKLEKIYSCKKIKFFLDQKVQFTRPPQRTSKLRKKPSALKREHPELQQMKFLNFFLLLWVIFVLLDPDPYSEYRSGSADPTESGSNSDRIRNPVKEWSNIEKNNCHRAINY